VLADGYYEWLRDGKTKLLYLYEMVGGKPFAFAGLWEWWPGPNGEDSKEGEAIESSTLITAYR